MTPRARGRLISILIVIAGLSIAAGLALYGLSGKITYFKTPTDLQSGQMSAKALSKDLRLGGMVKEKTLIQSGDSYTFTVTDMNQEVTVTYRGILPDLFREGQGIVADGRYDSKTSVFTATRILAKHDENYMPPDVTKAIQRVNTP